MATESPAIEKANPRPTISPWDLGEVEQALKKIRGISMMGSSADGFDREDAQWVFFNLAEVACKALEVIRAAEEGAKE